MEVREVGVEVKDVAASTRTRTNRISSSISSRQHNLMLLPAKLLNSLETHLPLVQALLRSISHRSMCRNWTSCLDQIGTTSLETTFML